MYCFPWAQRVEHVWRMRQVSTDSREVLLKDSVEERQSLCTLAPLLATGRSMGLMIQDKRTGKLESPVLFSQPATFKTKLDGSLDKEGRGFYK